MEEWRDIRGYEGHYQVSDLGRVFSCKRHHLLKLGRSTPGYLIVCLWKDGKQKTRQVHRLVAEQFIAREPEATQVNHRNCDITDNRKRNLEWVSPHENYLHAMAHGRLSLAPKGEQRPNAILRLRDVASIRQLASQGIKTRLIAQQYQVSMGHIRNIVLEKKWT